MSTVIILKVVVDLNLYHSFLIKHAAVFHPNQKDKTSEHRLQKKQKKANIENKDKEKRGGFVNHLIPGRNFE